MKSVIWNNGQRIIKQVLDWFSTSADSNISDRSNDLADSGVVYDNLNGLDIIVGDNNTPATPSITVRTGSAYDSAGERIIISDETLSYDATNPSDTTNDGLGNFVSTPHSTGSKNIPLTVNSFNYVWVDYLAATDESVFTLQQATNAKQFYKQDDGYNITVTTTNTPPTANSIYLGSVNLTGFGVVSLSTIDTSNRSHFLIKEKRVKIKTPLADLSNATSTYGYNQDLTLDDHIKAVGTGTITPTNPHGISLGDIGVDVETVVANHQKYMHSNGMIGDKSTLVSSLYPEFHPITPGDDYIVIKKLSANEVVNIDGITITSSDVPSDTTFLFSSSGDASGTYYIYLDKVTKSLVRTTIDPSSDPTKYPVVSAVWTAGFTPLFDGDLTSITDLRIFGTINNDKIDNSDTYEMAVLSLEDGDVSAPALTWQSDLDTGIYRSGSGILSFTSNGVLSANISGGQIAAVDGAVGSPAYSFLSDTDTGIYRSGSGILSFTSNGVLSASISGGQISAVDGSAALPAYAFLSDTNTGLYLIGGDTLGISSGGSLRLQIDNTATYSLTRFLVPTGTAGAPTYAFTSQPSSGMYADGGFGIKFSGGGTDILQLSSSTVIPLTNVTIQPLNNGSVTAPVYSFNFDNNTGLYNIGADQLGITSGGTIAANFGTNQTLLYAGGTSKLQVNTGDLTSTVQILHPLGSASAPTVSFTGDTNTGIFSPSADTVATATGGTTRLTTSSGGNVSTVPFEAPNDSVSDGYKFTSSGNTRINYNTTYGGIIFHVNGTSNAAAIKPIGYVRASNNPSSSSDVSFGRIFEDNTGIFYPAINTMAFSAGGVETERHRSSGVITRPSQPAFHAYQTSGVGTTGDGTVYTMLLNNVEYDHTSGFSGGTFTMPSAFSGGRMLLCGFVNLSGVATKTSGVIQLNTSNQVWNVAVIQNLNAGPNQIVVPFAMIVTMDGIDTVNVRVTVSGGAKDVNVSGDLCGCLLA